jgi:hypothetical protein
MFGWIKSLFSADDRPALAQERINVALEGIASDLEQARANLRVRLGLEVEETPKLESKSNGKTKKQHAAA